MVARRTHNPKAVGSNPAPATKLQSAEISVLFSFLDKGKFNRNKRHNVETVCLYLSILLDLVFCLIANIKVQWAFAIFETARINNPPTINDKIRVIQPPSNTQAKPSAATNAGCKFNMVL